MSVYACTVTPIWFGHAMKARSRKVAGLSACAESDENPRDCGQQSGGLDDLMEEIDMLNVTPRPGSAKDDGRVNRLDALGPCIYAVRMPDGLIKIGWSGEPGHRISRLAGLDGILALRIGATRAEETSLHQRLDGHAVKGREWYAETPTVVEVVNEMRAEMGMPPL